MELIDTINKYSLKIRNQTAKSITRFILPLFKGSGNILDVGCGTAHLGFMLSKLTNREVAFLDIKKAPFTHPEVKVKLYDGGKLPFPDNYFETSMAVFTLHHTYDVGYVLKEIVRVTQGNIIIVEDLLKSKHFIDFTSIVLKDLITNYFYTKITFQYKTVPEWEKIFKNLNLTIKKEIYFESGSFLNLKHVAWLLDVNCKSYQSS